VRAARTAKRLFAGLAGLSWGGLQSAGGFSPPGADVGALAEGGLIKSAADEKSPPHNAAKTAPVLRETQSLVSRASACRVPKHYQGSSPDGMSRQGAETEA